MPNSEPENSFISGNVIERDLEDLSYEQIAEVMDILPGTVKSRLARGAVGVAETAAAMRQ